MSKPMLMYCQFDPSEHTLYQITNILFEENAFENIVCNISAIFSQPQWSNWYQWSADSVVPTFCAHVFIAEWTHQ